MPPEISFYVLPTASVQERNLFACKLIEKAYRSGTYPFVLTDSELQNRELDDLLWSFRAGSFIPHQIYNGDFPEFNKTILISSTQPPEHKASTILNLSSHCPTDLIGCERILEILDNSEECKALGRSRYRQYQQAGVEPVTHKI